MTDHKDFKLELLQKKVWDEFKNYKVHKKIIPTDMRNLGQKLGCFGIPLIWLINQVSQRVLAYEAKSRNYVEYERKAEKLVQESEIKDYICGFISNLGQNEILTEEKFVKTLTAALCDDTLKKTFLFPQAPIFYAIMAFQISENGLEDYCHQT